MYKIGVIGVQESWSSELLAEAVAARTGSYNLINLEEVTFDLAEKRVVWKGKDLSQFDALIIKKISGIYSHDLMDRLEILRFLEDSGVSIFSKPSRIARIVNRLSCTTSLRLADLPMPRTVITEDPKEAVRTVKRFGQTVLKPLFSTKARGMVLIEPGMDIQKTVQEFQQDNQVMYLQQLVKHPGWDLGVTYLGGKYLATYKRLGSETSWNTTIRAGGAYQPYLPESEVLALANRAQVLFGLDFTCVDIVRTPDGYMIYEVSAFGGFRGLQDAHGIQAAELLVDYVFDSLTKATGSPGLEQTVA